jgi:hypothetical protein
MSVLLIGDSMAQGLSPHLNAETHYQVGWTTPRILSLALSWIRSSPAQVVLVALGTNDITARVSSQETAAAAQQILQAAAGRTVLWLGPPINYAGNAGIIPTLQSVCGGSYFDTRSLNLPMSGIHPTSAGFKTWANAVLSRLNGIGAGSTSPVFDAGGVTLLSSQSNTPRLLIYALIGIVLIKAIGD